MLRVSALYIYPIKSCGGIALERAHVERRGLQFDRRYMLVDANGRFLTQRQTPRLALFATAIEGARLRVTGPDGASLLLPLQPAFASSIPVKVWRSRLEAQLADADVNAWFSERLERVVQLVYMADHQHRAVSSRRATASDDEVSFADGAPILLTSEGSLADLNARLSRPVSMLRFRPNIVVDAREPFCEDTWNRIRIAGTQLEVAWACARCTMTTVDPRTGRCDDDGEPLATLRAYRRDGPGIFFGQNLLTRGAGVVSLGDIVEVNP